MALPAKHARFVAEYLIDLNATEAAKRTGYSPKSAYVQGCRLLRDAQIAAAVAAGQAKRLESAELTATRVLEEFRRLAFADPRTLFTEDGQPRPLHTLTAEQAACIASVDVVVRNAEAGDGHTDRVLKIRTWDKAKALESLAKHFGLLVERVQVSGDAELVTALASARKRAAQNP